MTGQPATGPRPGTLYGIGVGPGDPELLTLKAARRIAACQVVSFIQNLSGKSLARDIAAEQLLPDHIELPIAFRMSKESMKPMIRPPSRLPDNCIRAEMWPCSVRETRCFTARSITCWSA